MASPWYDEEKEISSFWSWVIIIAYCGAIMMFGLLVFFIVHDTERKWNFGLLPDPPAASIYHDRQPKRGEEGKQITPLPEARPKERMTGPQMRDRRQ